MAAALNAKRLSKSDAQTIAQGEQLSSDVDKRLRSASGKIYHAELNVQSNQKQAQGSSKMASIEEVLSAGGIDHAENSQATALDSPSIDHDECVQSGNSTCCTNSSQIIELIHKLQESVNTVNEKISASSAFQDQTEQRLTTLEKKQIQDAKEVSAVSEILSQYQVKVDILSDIVIKQNQEITELKNQMIDSQARGMKCNITIHGIPETESENCIATVNQFMVEKLKIKDKLIPIDHAYRFGSGKLRPVLVTLRHWSDKALIFSHVSNLKGLKQDGVTVFVTSQLPEALSEKRRKINSCMAANKKRPAAQKLPYSVKQGELLFRNKPITPKVAPPTPRQLLKLTDPEIEDINAIKLTEGVIEEYGDCTFRAYAVSASTHQEVNEAYKKMKLMHGEATHIACAYNLKKVPPPYNIDGCDDSEYGAARVLLQQIQEEGVADVAVFMVRYFGGKKLGPVRFDLIKKVSTSAIILWQVSLQDQHPSGDPWEQQAREFEEEQRRMQHSSEKGSDEDTVF